jgi:hypothetical protein
VVPDDSVVHEAAQVELLCAEERRHGDGMMRLSVRRRTRDGRWRRGDEVSFAMRSSTMVLSQQATPRRTNVAGRIARHTEQASTCLQRDTIQHLSLTDDETSSACRNAIGTVHQHRRSVETHLVNIL